MQSQASREEKRPRSTCRLLDNELNVAGSSVGNWPHANSKDRKSKFSPVIRGGESLVNQLNHEPDDHER